MFDGILGFAHSIGNFASPATILYALGACLVGLVIGALPFWDLLRRNARMRSALLGINAAVVGLLLAALYHPVWTAGIASARDFALAVAAFLLLQGWQVTPWLVVVLSAVGALVLAALP